MIIIFCLCTINHSSVLRSRDRVVKSDCKVGSRPLHSNSVGHNVNLYVQNSTEKKQKRFSNHCV